MRKRDVGYSNRSFTNLPSHVASGYGDADPSNVSALVRGAEMRVAETRAVNRALRKAYGIGLCSVEELGWTPQVARPLSQTAMDRTAAKIMATAIPPLHDFEIASAF